MSGDRCREAAAQTAFSWKCVVEVRVWDGCNTMHSGALGEVQPQMCQPGLPCSDQRVPAPLHHLQDVSIGF